MSLIDAATADEALRRLPADRRAASPKPGPDARVIRRRMQEAIVTHLTMSLSVTERDLERAGFSRAEIADHFTAACRAVKAHRIAA